MGQLHIPRLGTELVLSADWSFRLFHEHRNDGLTAAAGLVPPSRLLPDFWGVRASERRAAIEKSKWRQADGSLPEMDRYFNGELCHPLTLPAGALLSIDRIYIRKGNEGFDSVSFWLKAKQVPVALNGRPLKKSVRFWAKLDDANQIKFEDAA